MNQPTSDVVSTYKHLLLVNVELAHTPQTTHQGKSYDYHNQFLNGLFYCPPDLFVFNASPNTRISHSSQLVPFAKTAAYFNNFFVSTTRLWNSLPANYVHHDSVRQFKKCIQNTFLCTQVIALVLALFCFLFCDPLVLTLSHWGLLYHSFPSWSVSTKEKTKQNKKQKKKSHWVIKRFSVQLLLLPWKPTGTCVCVMMC